MVDCHSEAIVCVVLGQDVWFCDVSSERGSSSCLYYIGEETSESIVASFYLIHMHRNFTGVIQGILGLPLNREIELVIYLALGT